MEETLVVGAVSRDGMYVLISALDSDGKVEGIIVAAKSSGDDYDIGGSTFYGGVVHGEYTKDGDDWSVHAFADAITLEFDDSAGEVSVELHGEWNDDDGEGPGTLTYANDNGSLTVYDTNDDGEEDNLSGRVAPGGKFILLHKNNVSEDETEQDALIGVFIKQ